MPVSPDSAPDADHTERQTSLQSGTTNEEASQWCLYLLECAGGRLYSGITNRLQARLAAHRAGRGAKFTRAFAPQALVGAVAYANRSEASKAEWAIKRMPRTRKIAFITSAEGAAVSTTSPSP